MTHFLIEYETLGGHTHVHIWAGSQPLNRGKAGHLIFRNEEWPEFMSMFISSQYLVIRERGSA